MPVYNTTIFDNSAKACAAKKMLSSDRKDIATEAIRGKIPISSIASEHNVSRKFIYSQKSVAEQGIASAFEKEDPEVLFYLPVTKQWLYQFILALILICHSSYRGVREIFRDLFDYPISIGSIHNVVQEVVKKVKDLDTNEDLSRIKIGAPDEIFQGNTPVLAACDVESLYCYQLNLAEHRDGDTWAIHIMECQDKGLNLEYTIADFGKGIRAGQKEAMPGTPCLGDHFHVLYEMGKVKTYLENRAYRALKAADGIEKKMEKAKKKSKGHKLSKKMASARSESVTAINLSDDVGTLTDWMQEILSPIGPDLRTRKEMYEFIVEELRERESLAGKHRIASIRRTLENNKKEILYFAQMIDRKWEALEEELGVEEYLLRKMYELHNMPYDNPQRYKLESLLRRRLRGKFHFIQEAIGNVEQLVERASSAIENFNSRMRNYFFLRKQLGSDYLILLRFFLNQRRFLASEDPRRFGRSPAEVMLSKDQPHWLEQLGFKLFKRAA